MAWHPLDSPSLGPTIAPPLASSAGAGWEGADAACRAVAIIESARRPHLACPRCRCTAAQRNGYANGLQRFRCRDCRRTFNALTGTPLARLRRKDKWLAFCACLLDAKTTVRRAAEQIQVHRNTSFRWRHRMLRLTGEDRQLPLGGMVETETMHVHESHKGARTLARPPQRRARGRPSTAAGALIGTVCVLVARDREGRTLDAVTGRSPLTLEQLQRHLGDALHTDACLLTLEPEPYRQFAAAAGMAHALARSSASARDTAPPDRELHLHNVRAYIERLRIWLGHFRGVATRYLGNYCGWRWAIDGARLPQPEALLRCALGCFPSQG